MSSKREIVMAAVAALIVLILVYVVTARLDETFSESDGIRTEAEFWK